MHKVQQELLVQQVQRDQEVHKDHKGARGPRGPVPDPGPSCGCFLDGTKVLMPNGTEKNIEDVLIGESIACHFNGSAKVIGKRVGHAGAQQHVFAE